jgi:hypothetical protein
MNKQIEALKLALSAFYQIFESTPPYRDDGTCVINDKSVELSNKAIAAIKEALAQQEQSTGNILMDSYKAMQSMKVEGPLHVVCQCDKCKIESQEPVADWAASHNAICALLRQAHDALALTSYPMMHRWVGLTDEETERLIHNFGSDPHTLLDEVNARLKARNT